MRRNAFDSYRSDRDVHYDLDYNDFRAAAGNVNPASERRSFDSFEERQDFFRRSPAGFRSSDGYYGGLNNFDRSERFLSWRYGVFIKFKWH
jgi:hypothetical protein